jgi:glyceraldehyde 3-phosphate dehydrogenase
MGRLALRAAWDWPEFAIVHINEKAGDAATAAHLLKFDSVHGRWQHAVESDAEGLFKLLNG